MWLVWVLTGACLTPLLYLVMGAAIGWLMPPHVSARFLLLRRMRELGVDTARLPKACVADLAQMCLSLSAGPGPAGEQALRLSETIETMAFEVAALLAGETRPQSFYIADTLERHGLAADKSASATPGGQSAHHDRRNTAAE